MYKIRKICFQNHPILKNLSLDFCDSDNNVVDTVIIAGENGCGKSTLLDCLYRISSHKVNFSATVEVEERSTIHSLVFYSQNINSLDLFWGQDETGWKEIVTSPLYAIRYSFTGIFSDVDINFNAGNISTVTSMTLDSTGASRRSNNNLPKQIKQLLIDIQALDDAEISRQYKIAKENGNSTDNLHIKERLPRFTRVFNWMLDEMAYNRVENTGESKSILFQKKGVDISIDNLSSGEKQIVYRGCFLLKDINAINGALVFIDEPEISLHPNWQMKIMEYYKGIFTDENGQQTSQIFAVTHSPFIIHNENRKKDKVIVLTRDKDGNINVKDRPEYYKCSSIEVVQDAFSIKGFSADKPTVYLEGRTDEKYFNKALEVYDYDVPFRFKWIGYIDDRGQEVNTGQDSVNRAAQFLIAQNLPIKNVCLLDCDTNRKINSNGNVIVESIPQFENSKGITKGIENALVLAEIIDIKNYTTEKREPSGYAADKIIPVFEKMRFCEFICGLDVERQKVILANLKGVIDHLITLF